MSYLVDTNVLSELRKKGRANQSAVGWLRERDPEELYLSVLTVGELRRGAARIRRRDPTNAEALDRWVTQIGERFGDRILVVDHAIAEQWGEITAHPTLPDVDGLLAATALVHDLVVVTRKREAYRADRRPLPRSVRLIRRDLLVLGGGQ